MKLAVIRHSNLTTRSDRGAAGHSGEPVAKPADRDRRKTSRSYDRLAAWQAAPQVPNATLVATTRPPYERPTAIARDPGSPARHSPSPRTRPASTFRQTARSRLIPHPIAVRPPAPP